MAQWSIHGNVMNCIQYNRDPVDYFKLDVYILESKNHRRIYQRSEEDKMHLTN